ncbi:SMEK domain-containing protein [Roseivirga sp. BDSF3-8]|uniref:SMEK domain-containing protein n=1 Tax=Roseivirga sp. BDSF3-8 TaxID=3241598 RepID=UPI003531B247
MGERENYIKFISDTFAIWEVKIQNRNTISLHDANIISEDVICELLNILFGYKLINVNAVQINHPAIDLADEKNRIAFQVTSTKDRKKIQGTLNKYFDAGLQNKYDDLYFLVLGKKQSKYSPFSIPCNFSFDNDRHILGFQELLSQIKYLPASKLKKIVTLLQDGTNQSKSLYNNNSSVRLNRNLSLKKRMKKDLLLDLDRKYWADARYEPGIKFLYSQVIIRNANADTYPEDHDIPNEISNWFKIDFWDLYDRGIEFIGMGGPTLIFDKNGYWDQLNWRGDKRENNPDYVKVEAWKFLRIPYDFIVAYDMEPDPYNSLPSIYVDYAKDGMPYDEILYGIPGSRKRKTYTEYFDNKMRKELK